MAKRGRPKLAHPEKFKSISVPEVLWGELFVEAKMRKQGIGALATDLLRYGLKTNMPNEDDYKRDEPKDVSLMKDWRSEEDF